MGPSTYTDYDLAITDATERWLAERRATTQPWACFVSLVSPHYPLTAPKEYFDLYDPDTVDLPIAHARQERPVHAEVGNIMSFYDYDRHFDARKIREAKVAYYALTTFMDNCVGRIVDALNANGQSENTTIIYVSDHGDMMGDHGMWTKQVMYEASVGIPMIATGPGIPAGEIRATGTTLLDIAATASDIFEVTSAPDGLDMPGRSLLDIAQAADDPDRTIFSEYHDGGSTTGTFMVRWQNWKLVHYEGFDPQLFDLADDPDELRDLAKVSKSDPRVRAALQEGYRRLDEICDPTAVNALCFADQRRKIAELGGVEACLNADAFGHTPTPAEQASAKA